MQMLVALILSAFVLGGTRFGDWVRQRPVVLVPACAMAAATYYSLSVTW